MFFHASCEGLPAWAVGSYSSTQSAGGASQNIIFKILRQIGRPTVRFNLILAKKTILHPNSPCLYIKLIPYIYT